MGQKRPQDSHDGEKPAKRSKSDDADTSRTTVIVSALPTALTSERLSEIFSALGPIRSAFVAKSKEDAAKNQGYGFVRFVMQEDAQRAVADLNDSLQDGQKIRVGWARRRQRQETEEKKAAAPSVEKERPKWKEAKDSQKTRSVGLESAPDATRTVLVRGLSKTEDDAELKKTLYKKAKKLLAKHVGQGDISVQWPLELDGEPVAHIVTPNARTAQILASQLNNHIFKSQLLLCCQRFEREAVTRKGRGRGGARLIVRNLAWDVTAADLSAAFAAYGPLHSVDIPRKADAPDRARGFAFVWMLRKPDAEKAIAGVNGTQIRPGYAAERVTDGADNRKKSEKRKAGDKADKAQGRTVAVDWALSKDQWEAANSTDAPKAEEPEEPTDDIEDVYGRAPGEESDGYLSEELSDSDESMFGDHESSGEEESADAVDDDKPALDESAEQPDKKGKGRAAEGGMTLFVRNVQFEATEDELFSVFKRFGNVQYARIAKDSKTGRSRGTGFVHFYRAADAERVLETADKAAAHTSTAQPENPFAQASILQADPSSSSARSLSLHGRVLAVSKAVTREEAETIKESRDKANAKQDRRNLYLMREGVIVPNSLLANSLHRSDLEARESSLAARKQLIRTNPSLFISRTRLSVRQLPLFVNDHLLNKLARFALKAYDSDVKAGKQPALTADELASDPRDVLGAMPAPKPVKAGKPPPSRVRQAKVLRQDDRVDALTGEGRSKGYGFLQLGTHADALRVLRWANANRSVGAILRGWWRDDLASQIASVDKEPDGADKEARKQRLQAKLSELEQESERAEAKAAAKGTTVSGLEARAVRTLIVELSIENAVTVKRRDERAERSRVIARRQPGSSRRDQEDSKPVVSNGKKRKRDVSSGSISKKLKTEEDVKPEKKFGGVGSAIGRKRKERKMKRGGKP